MVLTVSPVPRIAIVIASTRAERFADHPLAWLLEQLGTRDDLELDVIDLRDHPLPFYDLATAPAWAQRTYTTDAERALGERIDAADGFVLLTNELNHGPSAALKNTLDHYFVEWMHKPVAFVGYGNVGGARAIEQLRQVVAELNMVSVRETVGILGFQLAPIRTDPAAAAEIFGLLEPRLKAMTESLLWWTRALKAARDTERPAG